jgi:gliding motility-associated-like protein
MKKCALSFLIIILAFTCNAQTDTSFWFAAPDVSSAYNYDRPILLRISSYQQLCNVTISQPAVGGLPIQSFIIQPNTTKSIDLTVWINSIECAPGNTIQNKGLKITSDNNISVYYEVNANGPNPELFALKGRNALGNEFYISSQYLLGNSPTISPSPLSSFNIVASEDNTSVTIIPTKNIVGHIANSSFTINLNKGQTYAAIATSQAATQHLQGSLVLSTKPIAITLADDLLQGTAYGGICEDLAGDQTVPVNIVGTEYIAIKSNLNFPYDKVYITATQNGTSVFQDGALVTTLNAGASTELSVSNNSTYIQSSAPVYAYQLSGYGCEVGSAVLPKITCTGSSSVSVARSTNESFTITLLVKNGGQNNFLINNVSGVISASQFAVVPATGGVWYAAKITLSISSYPNGSVIKISNTSNIFQLGVFQGGSLSGSGSTGYFGSAVGYFSNYNTLQAHAFTFNANICTKSSIQLQADTISSAAYNWTGPNNFISNAQNPVINNAAVLNSGVYRLTVTVPGCGSFMDSVIVMVNPSPTITKSNDTSICKNNSSIQLFALGGSIYLWSPSSSLSNPNIPNPIATPSLTTTYFVTVTDANKCSATDSVKITVNSLPTITKSNDTSLCKNNSSIQLFASGGLTYLWSPASSLNNPTIANPTATPTSTTTYFVTVKDANKCSATDSVKITVNSLPTITKSNDTSLCKNNSVQLFVSGGSTYLWSPASSLSNAYISNPTATPVTTTTYFVTVTDANKCSANDSVKIIVNSVPLITKSNDTSVCKNTPVQLFATGGSAYLWSPSSSLNNANIPNPVASPSSTTTYIITVTNANKCSAADSVKITVNGPSAFTISPDQSICLKDSKPLSATGGSTYLWQPAFFLNNPNISNPIATPNATTTFTVKIKDSTCNDSAILSTTISVLPLPSIKASKTNDIDCSNNSSQLNASGGNYYLWQPGNVLNDSTISTPVAKPVTTTRFYVSGTDDNGCKNIDTITVNVGLGGINNYYVPNAFTPNNDGLNDCIGISKGGNVTNLDFSIYNRFGERVFHTSNITNCWDGRYKGVLQNNGVYVYIISAKSACGDINKKGAFVLLK